MKKLLIVLLMILSLTLGFAVVHTVQADDDVTPPDATPPAGGGATPPAGGGVTPTPPAGGPVTAPHPTARPSDHIFIQNPLAADSITDFIHDIIKIILIIATPLIVLMIIVAGFMYVMAQGKPEKISQANKALLFALIGGLLILGAFVIEKIISGTVDAFMS